MITEPKWSVGLAWICIAVFSAIIACIFFFGCSPTQRPRATEEYVPNPQDFRHLNVL